MEDKTKPYKVSDRWEKHHGFPVRKREPAQVAVNLEQFTIPPESFAPPAPELPEQSEEERRLKLKRQFDYFAQLVIGHRGPYVYTESVKPVLNQLTDYFMGLDCGLDLNRAICLVGEPGRGKSLIMEVWGRTLRSFADPLGRYPENKAAFMFKRVVDLTRELQAKEGAREKTELLWTRKAISPDCEGLPFHTCLDDIGKEEFEKAYNYGVNPMTPILNARHKIFTKNAIMTHGTTNFDPEDLESLYSPAMVDRFHEMFNFVYLQGQSFRRI